MPQQLSNNLCVYALCHQQRSNRVPLIMKPTVPNPSLLENALHNLIGVPRPHRCSRLAREHKMHLVAPFLASSDLLFELKLTMFL
jgi:hypothetical protein